MQTKMTIDDQEKELILRGIVDSACKMSPKKRALSFCKLQQYKTAITRHTILFNNLTQTQRLPARPRDFRISLEIYFMKWRLVKYHIALCKNCKARFAKIFQDGGDYCLICWQEHTYPVK